MKRNILIFSLAIILASCTGFIKNNAQENAGWIVSLDEAVALSEKTGKPIMANFTGSDWCGWCIRLKAEVFDTPEFKDWASDNVILLLEPIIEYAELGCNTPLTETNTVY